MGRILVVGGTKFIGRHVVTALLARGHEVTLLNRGQSNPGLFAQLPLIRADRRVGKLPAAPLSEALRSQGDWDAAIDLSGYFPDDVEKLAQALKGRIGRYIFCSTISAYQPTATGASNPYARETDPLLACTPQQALDETMATYGNRKAECERRLLDQATRPGGTPVVILRPGVVYGAFDYTDRMAYWFWRAAQSTPFILPDDGLTITRRTYAPDLAKAFATCISTDNIENEAFHIMESEPVSFRRIFEILQSAMGSRWPSPPLERARSIDATTLTETFQIKPWFDFPLWTPRTHLLADLFKARSLLPFEETPAAQALAQAAEDFLREDREPQAGITSEREREILEGLIIKNA